MLPKDEYIQKYIGICMRASAVTNSTSERVCVENFSKLIKTIRS